MNVKKISLTPAMKNCSAPKFPSPKYYRTNGCVGSEFALEAVVFGGRRPDRFRYTY